MKKSNGKTSVLYNSLTSIVSIAIVAEKYLRRMPRSKYDSNVVLDGNKSLLPDNTLLTCPLMSQHSWVGPWFKAKSEQHLQALTW